MMNEKQLHILEAAIRLFARKGYHATSIQEIVDELGIAKGSLYFYFKSKEDLLVSIYKYYIDLISKQVSELQQDENLSPRRRLEILCIEQYKFIIKHSDFIKMQLQERVFVSKEIEKALMEFRSQMFFWRVEQILETYGPEVQPYVMDAATLFGSIMMEYLSYIIFDHQSFELERLAEFVVDRLEDVLSGMMTKGKPPLIDEKKIEEFRINFTSTIIGEKSIIGEIRELIAIVGRWELEDGIAPEEQEEIVSTLTLLEKELQKDEPQILIIKGLLAFLKERQLPGFEKHLNHIQNRL